MQITTFDDMIAAARRVGPVPIAVAAAHDPEVLRAVERAQREGMVEATLVGDWPAMEAYAAQIRTTGSPEIGQVLSRAHIVHEPDPHRAGQHVVRMARQGEAAVVVKGQIKTADLLSAALNRHVGIRGRGLLTHVALFELPGLDRLVYLSDSGVVVYPDVYQKLDIINNVVAVARLFGVERPKVAILAASETVSPKIPASIDALALAKMAEQG
jgi:phosphate butyryltransferase